MHARHVSQRFDATATATPTPQTLGFGRVAALAAMVALLALSLVRPGVGANQSGPTINEISWGLSGLCRALGGIDDVNPTRFPTEGGGSVLLNVYFKCKGGILDGLNCKIGDAGDPAKGSCTFKSAPSPRQWASISRITNGAVHDLVSVNDLVQGASPTQWATISQITRGAEDLVPASDQKNAPGDAGRDSQRDGKSAGSGTGKHGKRTPRTRT